MEHFHEISGVCVLNAKNGFEIGLSARKTFMTTHKLLWTLKLRYYIRKKLTKNNFMSQYEIYKSKSQHEVPNVLFFISFSHTEVYFHSERLVVFKSIHLLMVLAFKCVIGAVLLSSGRYRGLYRSSNDTFT